MMAKGKGGMVLIIGMGGKPKKGKKDSVKKAVREPRQRGGGGASDRARLHSFKQKMRADPEHLDRVLGSLGIERNLLERIVEGKPALAKENTVRGLILLWKMIQSTCPK